MTVLRDYAAALVQPTLPVSSAGGGPARYDEVVAPDGALRQVWKGMSAAADLTPAELSRVDDEITKFLADDGVTFAPPGEGVQAWGLDPVPLVIDAATWAPLEVGLAQRAELLNALLADLYGPQHLLAEGVVPAAAVLGHAGFVRANARPTTTDLRRLVLSGTDLGRDASGTWRVLRDRVQAPSGLGYAMENRRVISRVLPELYQDAGLHRIDPYLAALRSALLQSAHGDHEEPRVVVLSPGTLSETAFDQAFLARGLGFPLVQGSDLVVRDGWVWMKPPGWPHSGTLDRVDVILRRVDAEWCDPLELRGESRLGVAGLVEAVRRGRVRLVNGLGAGVLENPGLLPHMPAICEALLGEQLRLPSVPTWWCGDPDSLDHVLTLLATAPESIVVRAIDGRRLELAGLAPHVVRERVLAAPHRYVGQELLPLSQAPSWGEGGRSTGEAEARPLVLRTFTLRYSSAYRPLVGGLATIFDERSHAIATKDVWVLKAAPGDPDQGLAEVAPVTHLRSVTVLPPRALEDMFWSGRYAERAEDLLRLVLTAFSQADRLRVQPTSAGGASVLVIMGAITRAAGVQHAGVDDELRSVLLDADRTGSVAQSLARLRDALEGVRDQLSGDTWRAFGDTSRAMAALRRSTHSYQIAESAGGMLTGTLALHGVTQSMIRDAGWNMIEAGRFIERATQLCSLLAATTTVRRASAVDDAVLDGVLAAAESSVTHRRRYRDNVRTKGVLELLLADPENPRSLAFAFARLGEHLTAMPASTGSTRPERLLEHLRDALDAADVDALVAVDGIDRPELRRFLDDTTAQLAQLADAVGQLHFAGGPAPQPMSALSLTEVMGVSA